MHDTQCSSKGQNQGSMDMCHRQKVLPDPLFAKLGIQMVMASLQTRSLRWYGHASRASL